MAYSDYGGRVYRNGERREDRCDAVLSPEGIKSTPGMWPGWMLEEGRSGGAYHALLGDGPIFVGLYKQTVVTVHRLGEEVDLVSLVEPSTPEAIGTFTIKPYEGERYVDTDYFKERNEPMVVEVDGHRIEARFTEEDNHYLYVRLVQPDGAVWCGWSGYGVGAGLDEAGYGYDSDDRDHELRNLWPDAVGPTRAVGAPSLRGE